MNVDSSKPVPKSLHTVTAIVNVAKFNLHLGASRIDALEIAMDILDLSGRDDTHDLAGQALKQIKAIERKIS